MHQVGFLYTKISELIHHSVQHSDVKERLVFVEGGS